MLSPRLTQTKCPTTTGFQTHIQVVCWNPPPLGPAPQCFIPTPQPPLNPTLHAAPPMAHTLSKHTCSNQIWPHWHILKKLFLFVYLICLRMVGGASDLALPGGLAGPGMFFLLWRLDLLTHSFSGHRRNMTEAHEVFPSSFLSGDKVCLAAIYTYSLTHTHTPHLSHTHKFAKCVKQLTCPLGPPWRTRRNHNTNILTLKI